MIAERSVALLFSDAFAANSFVNVAHDSVRGRHLVARQAVAVGDTLIDHEAAAARVVLNDACHQCLLPLTPDRTSRCSRCQLAYYCGATCQRAHWSAHRDECAALAQLPENGRAHLSPQLLLAIRVAWLFIRERDSPRVKRIATLVTNVAYHSEAVIAEFNKLATLCSRVLFLQKAPDCQYVAVPFLTSILSTLGANAIGITEPVELTDVGIALFDRLSLLNHSCDPNAVVLFDGAAAILRALKPIAAGDELTISYIDRASDRYERRQQLLSQYFFTCSCSRCSGPAGDDVFEIALRCLDTDCGGQVTRTSAESSDGVCSRCGSQRAFEPPAATVSAASSLAVARGGFDDRARTAQFERLLLSGLHGNSLYVRRFLQSAERDALQATLRGDVPFAVAARWSHALLAYERRRVGDGVDPILSKQVYAAGRLALEANDATAALPLLREAMQRLKVTCTSQKLLRDIYTYALEAERLLK
jgi:SET and MYND domain-containing protein